MRALWVTNVPPNVASASLGRAANPFGGWLDGSLHALEDVSQIGIDLAFPDAEAAGTDGEDNGHRIVPFSPIYRRDAKRKGVRRALEVLDGTEPDVLHVHGTELPHSYSFLEAARQRGLPHVVSVQGLASMCARHMAAFLPLGVVHGIGSRPWVRSDRVDGMRRSMTAAGALEAAGLSIATDAIGRTTWDRACLEAINPNLAYHHCDETLRPGFYSATWNPTGAVRHSIFVSQGHYPIKGLHLLLEALPTVISRFPDTSVLVAGTSPLELPAHGSG